MEKLGILFPFLLVLIGNSYSGEQVEIEYQQAQCYEKGKIR